MDCDSCRPSCILPANSDALRLWDYVADQVILAPMGGVISINAQTAFMFMDKLGIRNQLECWRKVRFIFQQINDEIPKTNKVEENASRPSTD